MSFVYILKSEKNGRYYIGSTDNLDRRIIEHNSGKTHSLKYLVPLRIVFHQKFTDNNEAKQMEQKLKRIKSRKILEQTISDGYIKMGL